MFFTFSTYHYAYVSLMDSVFEWTWSILGNYFYCYSEKSFPLHLYSSKPKRTICSLVAFLCQDGVAEDYKQQMHFLMGYVGLHGCSLFSELVPVTSVSGIRLPKYSGVAAENPMNFVRLSLTFHFGRLSF